MNNVYLNILEGSGRLIQYKERIKILFDQYLPILDEIFSLKNFDVVVCDDKDHTIPGTGFGGSAYNQNLVMVYVNPEFEDLDSVFDEQFKSTLAHEISHIVRWQSVGYGKTLLEAIVSEGIADYCDNKINDTKPNPWSNALSDVDLQKYIAIAKEEWDLEKYDHSRWFFGTRDLPKWTGYSIGYYLVAKYIESNNNIELTKLARTDSRLLIDSEL